VKNCQSEDGGSENWPSLAEMADAVSFGSVEDGGNTRQTKKETNGEKNLHKPLMRRAQEEGTGSSHANEVGREMKIFKKKILQGPPISDLPLAT
jgi:hypothetical protein